MAFHVFFTFFSFYDFFPFTRPSPIVNGFPSFAMDLRVANWRPTYLISTPSVALFLACTYMADIAGEICSVKVGCKYIALFMA